MLFLDQSRQSEETGLVVKVQTFIHSASIYCLSVRPCAVPMAGEGAARDESDNPWVAQSLLRASDYGRTARIIEQKKKRTGYCHLLFPREAVRCRGQALGLQSRPGWWYSKLCPSELCGLEQH